MANVSAKKKWQPGIIECFHPSSDECIVEFDASYPYEIFGRFKTIKFRKSFPGVCDLGRLLRVGASVLALVGGDYKHPVVVLGYVCELKITDLKVRDPEATFDDLPDGYLEYSNSGEGPTPGDGFFENEPAEEFVNIACDDEADIIEAALKEIRKWNDFPISELYNVLIHPSNLGQLASEAFPRGSDDLERFLSFYSEYFHVYRNDCELRVSAMPYFSASQLKIAITRYSLNYKLSESQKKYEMVLDASHCAAVVMKLTRRAGRRRTPLPLALDCEGVDLGKFGTMTLLQLCTTEGLVYLFDLTIKPHKFFSHGRLKYLLQNPKIIKVVHDCRSDQSALYHHFHVKMRNVFDTSIAYQIIRDQCNVSPQEIKRPSLSSLGQLFGINMPMKTSKFHKKMIYTPNFWKIRPLTDEMIRYAMDDVFCLMSGIYQNLNRMISPLWWPRFCQECRDTIDECTK